MSILSFSLRWPTLVTLYLDFNRFIIARLEGHQLQIEVFEKLQDSIHGLNAHLNSIDLTKVCYWIWFYFHSPIHLFKMLTWLYEIQLGPFGLTPAMKEKYEEYEY